MDDTDIFYEHWDTSISDRDLVTFAEHVEEIYNRGIPSDNGNKNILLENNLNIINEKELVTAMEQCQLTEDKGLVTVMKQCEINDSTPQDNK